MIIQTGSPLILIQAGTDSKDIWLNNMKIYVSNNKYTQFLVIFVVSL